MILDRLQDVFDALAGSFITIPLNNALGILYTILNIVLQLFAGNLDQV